MALNIWNIVGDLSNDKKNLLKQDSELEKLYIPFIINRSFSNFIDTLMLANDLNQYPNLDKKLQHDFYFHSIRPRKRFSKWNKSIQTQYIEAIQNVYACNIQRANEISTLLDEKQLESVLEFYTSSQGGKL